MEVDHQMALDISTDPESELRQLVDVHLVRAPLGEGDHAYDGTEGGLALCGTNREPVLGAIRLHGTLEPQQQRRHETVSRTCFTRSDMDSGCRPDWGNSRPTTTFVMRRATP